MKNPLSVNWLSWLFLALNLFSAYYISIIKDFQLWFVLLLAFNIILALFSAKRINNAVLTISRVLVGLLFIYSGFVKGVDPLGTQFRIEDYFYVWDMVWAIPAALTLSIFMNLFEFSIGALLLTKINAKRITTLALLMMLFFSLTTIYDAIYNEVPDCGCFGDALIITNWQTFYKNLVIDSFILVLFFRRKDIKLKWPSQVQAIVFSGIIGGFLAFENYNIQHLPVLDFRPWKVGNRLLPENPKPIKYYLTYKNTSTGETKEFLSKDLPWQDSVFMANWKWKSSREDDPNFEEKRTFPMVDEAGDDWSSDIVQYDGGVLIISIYDITKMTQLEADILSIFVHNASDAGLNIVLLNSNATSVFEEYKKKFNLHDMELYSSDDTALKAAVRSNPGLIIVKDAVVLAKYHVNDFPEIETIKKILN